MDEVTNGLPKESFLDPDLCSLVLFYGWMDMETAKLYRLMEARSPAMVAGDPATCWAEAVSAVADMAKQQASEWEERRRCPRKTES